MVNYSFFTTKIKYRGLYISICLYVFCKTIILHNGFDSVPKITNNYYLAFRQAEKDFEPILYTEFKEKLNKIQYKNKAKQMEARSIAICAYWSGLRPVEILDLKPENFSLTKKQKNNKPFNIVYIFTQGRKGGIKGKIAMPYNKETKELYEYSKMLPEGAWLFSFFRKPRKNKVVWHKKINYWKDNKIQTETTNMHKTYERTTSRMDYFAKKWFGWSFYYFRHNRFTSMLKHGASKEDIRLQKLGKTETSVLPYLKFDTREADKRLDFIQED